MSPTTIISLICLAATCLAATSTTPTTSPTSCWALGWRNPGDLTGKLQCPSKSLARPKHDMHNPNLPYTDALRSGCCRYTCKSIGWRTHGDSNGTLQCPANYSVLQSDGHDPTKTHNASHPVLSGCCRTNCYKSGWRPFGTNEPGTRECPERTRARSKDDWHRPDKEYSQAECCWQTCATLKDPNVTKEVSKSTDKNLLQCPTGSLFVNSKDNWYDFSYRKCKGTGCTVQECCTTPTCKDAGWGTKRFCPSGLVLMPNTTTCHEDKTCPEKLCCGFKAGGSATSTEWKNCYQMGVRKHGDTTGSYQCPNNTVPTASNKDHWRKTNSYFTQGQCCSTTCHSVGWRNAGDKTGSKTCPDGYMARRKEDTRDCTQSMGRKCTASDCCQRTCYAAGWRNAGDTSGKNQCKTHSNARGITDYHDCSSSGCSEKDCCFQTCWKTGWRNHGVGKMQCPKGTEARSEHDSSQPADFDVLGCCQYKCGAFNGTCPSTKKLIASSHCEGGRKDGCTEKQCCQPTCQTSFNATQCNAKTELLKEMSEGEYCYSHSGNGCSKDQCCDRKPSPHEYKCWYYEEGGKAMGWRTPGAKTQPWHLECPNGTQARQQYDGHKGDGFSEKECCIRTCWAMGWRNNGDKSGTLQCPADTTARRESDSHDCTSSKCSKDDCCPHTCWSAGWRKFGDKSGTKECPRDSYARHEYDTTNCKSESNCAQSSCCIPTCASSGFSAIKCPAKTKFKGAQNMCWSSGSSCSIDDCCELTCADAGFKQSQCPAGMTLYEKKPGTYYDAKCSNGTCTWRDCCHATVPNSGSKSARTCYAAGFRDSTATISASPSGLYKCPAGQIARRKEDGHSCGNGFNGLRSGQCFSRECCGQTCTDFFGQGGKCPAGKQANTWFGSICAGAPGGRCDQRYCCYVGCSSWKAAGGSCPAGKVFKELEGCEGGRLSGCNQEKCCDDPGPCDAHCGPQTATFNENCNMKWNKNDPNCTAMGKFCNVPSCDRGNSNNWDENKCHAGLNTCVDCTPNDAASKCNSCLYCLAGTMGVSRLKGQPRGLTFCKRDDDLRKDSKPSIFGGSTTCGQVDTYISAGAKNCTDKVGEEAKCKARNDNDKKDYDMYKNRTACEAAGQKWDEPMTVAMYHGLAGPECCGSVEKTTCGHLSTPVKGCDGGKQQAFGYKCFEMKEAGSVQANNNTCTSKCHSAIRMVFTDCNGAEDKEIAQLLLNSCDAARTKPAPTKPAPSKTAPSKTAPSKTAPSKTAAPTAAPTPHPTTTKCTKDQYESRAPSHNTATGEHIDRKCTPLTTCISGIEYQSVAPTLSSDRKCSKLTICTQTEFQSAMPTPTSDRVCSKLTECQEGKQFQSKAPTKTSNRVCSAFIDCDYTREYRTANGTKTSQIQCSNLTKCTADQFLKARETQTKDRVCQDLSVCDGKSTYQAGMKAVGMGRDRNCVAVTGCDGPGQYEQTAPTKLSDRICAQEVNCTERQTKSGSGATAFCSPKKFTGGRRLAASSTQTQIWEKCASGQYMSKGSIYQNTPNPECKKLTTCSDKWQYESVQPSLTSYPNTDRTCSSLQVCKEPLEFQSIAPTNTSNRACAAVTPCDSTSHYETAAATSTANTQCAALTLCDYKKQYVSRRRSLYTDRSCSTLTSCTSTQYESTIPSKYSDRACTERTVCPATHFVSNANAKDYSTADSACTTVRVCSTEEYETIAPTKSGNRVCDKLTVCNATTHYETTAPTSTSDRACGKLTVCTSQQYVCVKEDKTRDRKCCTLAPTSAPTPEAIVSPKSNVSEEVTTPSAQLLKNGVAGTAITLRPTAAFTSSWVVCTALIMSYNAICIHAA